MGMVALIFILGNLIGKGEKLADVPWGKNNEEGEQRRGET
jgi:hypothetical protein